MANLKTLSERIVDSAGTGQSDPTELGTLSGLTATTAELNVLDGVTVTTAEINKLSGSGAVVASGTTAVLIADPTGGATIDAEARTAINAILAALKAFDIVAAA